MKLAYFHVPVLLIAFCSVDAQKIDPNLLVNGSLDTIAPAEKRQQLTNLVAFAGLKYSVGPNHKDVFNGPAVIVTEGTNVAYAFALPFQDSPQEKFSYDGKLLRIGFVRPGIRSLFGEFLHNYSEIVKDRLFGGAYRRVSLVNDRSSPGEKLSFDGTKKLDGRELFVVSSITNSGSGLLVRLYFEKETSRHVRTEFTRVVGAALGTRQQMPEHTGDTRQTLIEEFSDFKTENGVTLPRTYKIRVTIETGGATKEILYVLDIKAIQFNQQLDPSTFNIEVIK